jgi:hypothetical protein
MPNGKTTHLLECVEVKATCLTLPNVPEGIMSQLL